MKHQSILSLILFALCCGCYLVSGASVEKRAIGSCYTNGKAVISYYWIPKEGDVDLNDKGKTVTLTGKKNKKLKDKNKKKIATVAKKFRKKIRMEGTGLLENGQLINLGTSKKIFMELDRSKTPYGVGSTGVALVPFVSVASNDIKIGKTLYVEELDGVKLPNGEKHNGCVRVDDESWSMGGCQIDFFALQFTAYQSLYKSISSKVTVTEKSCSVKSYVTSAVKSWAEL